MFTILCVYNETHNFTDFYSDSVRLVDSNLRLCERSLANEIPTKLERQHVACLLVGEPIASDKGWHSTALVHPAAVRSTIMVEDGRSTEASPNLQALLAHGAEPEERTEARFSCFH